ncbi:MAG: glycosyltransferase family 2 protein, partial [Acidimicrobiia bacterium]
MTDALEPEIDVVILTWNDGDLLDKAVRSAVRSEGVRTKVVVVDNGSDPPATVAASPDVVVVRNEENAGVARGRNQGAALGSADLLCFLDSDAELAPHSL